MFAMSYFQILTDLGSSMLLYIQPNVGAEVLPDAAYYELKLPSICLISYNRTNLS
jgi:hypothetical protein